MAVFHYKPCIWGIPHGHGNRSRWAKVAEGAVKGIQSKMVKGCLGVFWMAVSPVFHRWKCSQQPGGYGNRDIPLNFPFISPEIPLDLTKSILNPMTGWRFGCHQFGIFPPKLGVSHHPN